MLLNSTGIRSHGSLNTSAPGDWAFACFKPMPGVPVAKVGSTTPAVQNTTSGNMQCVATFPISCDATCCETSGVSQSSGSYLKACYNGPATPMVDPQPATGTATATVTAAAAQAPSSDQPSPLPKYGDAPVPCNTQGFFPVPGNNAQYFWCTALGGYLMPCSPGTTWGSGCPQ